MHETVTRVTDLSAHEVAVGWPADAFTWINNVWRTECAVSCLLTDHVGPFDSLLNFCVPFGPTSRMKRVVVRRGEGSLNT